MHSPRRLKRRQTGAVIVTVAFALLFLLGFMGIALDFGHLFVVKTELQTAADSCALAAAQELDRRQPMRLPALPTPGMTAGNLNKVNFQGAAAGFVDADITFSDSLVGSYDRDPARFASLQIRQVRAHAKAVCRHGCCRRWERSAATLLTKPPKAYMPSAVATLLRRRPLVIYRSVISKWAAQRRRISHLANGYSLRLKSEPRRDRAVSGWFDLNPGGKKRRIREPPGRRRPVHSARQRDTVMRESGKMAAPRFAYNTRFGIYQGSKAPPADGIARSYRLCVLRRNW